MIRRMMTAGAAVMLSLVAAQNAAAQTATVAYEVAAINEVTVSGDPAKLLIDAASELAGVSDSTTTWAVTTNQSSMKVQGAVSTALPSGVTLKVTLGAPAGATSTGAISLGTTATDLVTGITQLEATGLPVVYTLSATPGAGTVTASSATVTYTIVAGA